MRSKLQLSAALIGAALALGLAWAWRARVQQPAPAEVAEAPRESWDRCLPGIDAPVDRLLIFSARVGTVRLGDAGCEWLTGSSDGGALTATRHKIFGTLRRGATTSPDVRVIGEKVTSMAESVEWHDDDGDGRRDLERRVAFGPNGEERRIEQLEWNDAGQPETRSVITALSPATSHVLQQRFVDGGWTIAREYDAPYKCEYRPIVPIRPQK